MKIAKAKLIECLRVLQSVPSIHSSTHPIVENRTNDDIFFEWKNGRNSVTAGSTSVGTDTEKMSTGKTQNDESTMDPTWAMVLSKKNKQRAKQEARTAHHDTNKLKRSFAKLTVLQTIRHA
jgi:hypothetical protein